MYLTQRCCQLETSLSYRREIAILAVCLCLSKPINMESNGNRTALLPMTLSDAEWSLQPV